MMGIRIALATWVFWGVLALSHQVQGQIAGRSYQPAQPTTSPYLNLLRSNFGPLPNYHSLVRPQLQQQETNRDINRALEYNFRQLTALQQRPQEARDEGGRALRVRTSRMQPTGVPAQFQYYSHYYPSAQQRGLQRR